MYVKLDDPFRANAPAPDPATSLVTSLGGYWSLLCPRPQDVRIADLAAGLSRGCRYNGQVGEHMDNLSISEHSVLMLEYLIDQGEITSLEDALEVLLHDASEAYLGDMISPIKSLIPDFKRLENNTQTAIKEAFGLTGGAVLISKARIKEIDNRIRLDEADVAILDPASKIKKQLMTAADPDIQPLGVKIRGLEQREARIQFLRKVEFCLDRFPARTQRLADAVPAIRKDVVQALSLAQFYQQKRASKDVSAPSSDNAFAPS